MNPAEKVRAILDQLRGPLYKDDPFGTEGRKILFDGSCSELNNFSFQAFVNRINTFKADYWGSDPNAALYLAKYGFKNVSECRVQCCSCEIAVEMQIFLGKPDVLLTLAKQSHKQHCRWSYTSMSKAYFSIPRDPYRSLQDMNNTFLEMMTFGSNLPIVLKRNWIKMGISEDFVMAVLNFLKFQYSDLLASCVVLSLCGWVKRGETSLQCNFCRRVVGIWNFFNDNSDRRCPPITRSNVISILYNQIRHDMSFDEVETIGNHSEGTAEQNPVGVTELNNSVASEVLSGEGSELQNEEVMEVNSVDMTELTPLRESEQLHCDPPSRSAWTHDSSSRSDGSLDADPSTVESIVDKAWDEYTFLRAQEIKKKALRFLWNRHKRSREPYFCKLQRLKLYRQEADEIEKHVDEDHRLIPESTSSENYTETEQYCDTKENSDVSYNSAGDHDEKIQSVVDSECNSYNYGASSDKNGFYSTEHDVREEYCTQSKSHTSSPGHETIVIDSSSEVKSSNNSYKSADDATEQSESDVENKCQPCVVLLNSNCVNRKECVVKLEKVNVNECSNESDMPSIQSNQSEKSCDVAAVSHDDSDGRRKRKRVPECERNGKPYDSELLPVQKEPAHFTRSKKKELEMMNERLKSTNQPSNDQQCHDSGHEIIELLSSEGEAASENETKTLHCQAEPEGNQVCSDIVNTNTPNTRSSENNSLNMSNHEDHSELTPVICSVVGNAVIPDTSEEEMDKDDEFSRGPIIVSAKSVCDEGMLQDYMEEEGRKFENGYRVKHHCYSDISEIDSAEKSVSDTVTSKSYDASDDTTSTLEECPESCRCKRKRRVSDEYSNRPSKIPNVEDTNYQQQVPNVEDSNDHHQVPNVDDTNSHQQVPNAQDTICPRVPNIEDLSIELTPSYFHPELEHRYWCIWKIKTADHAQSSLLRMKGWEFYMDAIKQGLELQNTERITVCQAESDAIHRLADILAVARERNA